MRHASAFFGFSVVILLCFGVTAPAWAANGQITGLVTDDRSSGSLGGTTVSFVNAINATVVAEVRADSRGHFDSGSIAEGIYKVHFHLDNYLGTYYDVLCKSHPCEEVFDLATNIQVTAGSVTNIEWSMTFIGPTVVVYQPLEATGVVDDEQIHAPLANITAEIRDAISGLVLLKCPTDATGQYRCRAAELIYSGQVKIRFSDPINVYRPEYSGAGGQDNFAMGLALTAGDKSVIANESMIKKAAADLIDDLVASIPPNAPAGLGASLDRAKHLVTDSNPNNDVGACGVLTGFLNGVSAGERSGQLSASQAAALRAGAHAVRVKLGC